MRSSFFEYDPGYSACNRAKSSLLVRHGSASNLLVRFYALDHVDIGALRAQLMERLDLHTDRLRQFTAMLQRHYSGKELSLSQTGRLVGLRMGMRYEQICIEWCQDALRCLPASAVVEPAAIPIRRKTKAV